MKRMSSWIDLPPSQAGLAAALQRVYSVPANDCSREFDELLRKLA